MTVPNEIPSNNYIANGVVKKFSVTFDYETVNTLRIKLNGNEPSTDKYYIDDVDHSFNFYLPPNNGDIIYIYRETPLERDIDYDNNYNSFRPKTVNTDFDRVWRAIQEYISAIVVNSENLEKEILDRIKADEDMLDYIMNQDNSLKKDYISRDALLKKYIDDMIALVTGDPSFSGIDDSQITTWSGRTQESKNKDSIHVLDFKIGNKTDQEVIQDAVNYCIENGKSLNWGGSTLTSASNIVGFWSIKHYGNGVLIKGVNSFSIQPLSTTINKLHVSTNGSDSNDGLSPDTPILTLSRVRYMLGRTSNEMRNGTIEVNFAAGTYADATNFVDLPNFEKPIRLIGAGTARNPLTIFDGALSTYKTAGMYFTGGANIYAQYLKFQNFANGYGLLAEKNCRVELKDCDAIDCLVGFAAGYSSFIRTTRSLARNCNTGFRAASNGQASFTPDTDNIIDSNRAYGCGIGFAVTRDSYAHIDYNEIEDCTTCGVLIEMNSRAATLANNFKRNAVAVMCWTSGYASIDASKPDIFNQNTPDANTEVYQFRGSSGIVNLHGQAGTMYSSIFKSTTPQTVSGTALDTQVYGNLFTAWAGWFIEQRKRIKIRVWGTVTTPANSTITLRPKIASTSLSTLVIPSNINNQVFIFESEVVALGTASQKTISSLTCNGVSISSIHPTGVDCFTASRGLTFSVDPNGTDSVSCSITVESVEVEICG